jgi:hypothetical protein
MPEPSAQQMISGFVTGAASAPAAVVAARVPAHTVSTPADVAAEFYFDLQIVEEIPADPFDDPQMIELQPGQQIHLRVTTCDNCSAGQRAFKIRGGLQFYLRSLGTPAASITITEPRLKVSHNDLDTLAHDFEITLSGQCPRGEVTFELLFIEDGKGQKFTAANLSRNIAVNENPNDSTLLESIKVNLNAAAPENVAILHIEAPSADKYRMKGWNRRVDSLAIELAKPDEKIGLADFVEGEVSPDDVRGIIKSVSRRASQALLKWFQQLHRKHGQRLCLIIADHTDAEVPWEMIEFEPGKNLGAMCVVARWIPVQNFAAWQELAVVVQEQCGGVVAHLDYQELEHTAQEQQVLTQLKADFRDDVKALRQRLAQSLENVGLVYLACHGIFTYNKKHEAAVGSLKNPAERISAVQLEDLPQLSGARPLFFVNACHSARLMRDSQGFYGLPEVMLALLASGYIGTLGPVGMEYAPVIGQQILEKARCSPAGINPAEELRRIRAEAVQQLEQQPSLENMLNFVFAFMYVYYGNPLASLRLTGAGDQEVGE